MQKRKKIKESYNNVITKEFEEKYLNAWFQEKMENGVVLYSFLIRAEADSVIQVMLSENVLYSNIYHLTKFEFIEKEDSVNLKIDDLELLKEIRENNMEKIVFMLEDLCKKYSGQLEKKKEFLKNPLTSNAEYKEMRMI